MRKLIYGIIVLFAIYPTLVYSQWKPVAQPMMTQWGKTVTPENAWKEYPRPQFVRENWQNLNGLWECSVLKMNQPQPQKYKGNILVPFCVESALSGVGGKVNPDDRIWYRRKFDIAPNLKKKNIILHLDGVDYSSFVFVNGSLVGSHKGAFDRFSFDITPFLKENGSQGNRCLCG